MQRSLAWPARRRRAEVTTAPPPSMPPRGRCHKHYRCPPQPLATAAAAVAVAEASSEDEDEDDVEAVSSSAMGGALTQREERRTGSLRNRNSKAPCRPWRDQRSSLSEQLMERLRRSADVSDRMDLSRSAPSACRPGSRTPSSGSLLPLPIPPLLVVVVVLMVVVVCWRP